MSTLIRDALELRSAANDAKELNDFYGTTHTAADVMNMPDADVAELLAFARAAE